MSKQRHEVRDAIHGFIIFDPLEKKLMDSQPMQRLRCIHQLAMTYQVYPGATHKRFEHSLGVMEFAGRIFDQLFNERERLPDDVHGRIADEMRPESRAYWRRVVRIGGLLHDLGHLPFSHAAEKELLPEGWNHERLTAEMIRHSEIADILRSERPPVDPEDVVDVAWDAEKRAKEAGDGKTLSPWRNVLNEIICGNTFGGDRIDYLLRDSLHAGVAYGRFDPDRLISGLTALVDPEDDEIAIGLLSGAIHSAEALLLARYFMYTQVYFHDVRRVYDLHLKEFLRSSLPGGQFPCDWRELMAHTDHEVLSCARAACADPNDKNHVLAQTLLARRHYRTVYELVSPDKKARPTILADLVEQATNEFGAERIRSDKYGPKSETNNFPVKTEVDTIESSLRVSGVIANLPPVEIGLVFAHPDISERATKWAKEQVTLLIHSATKGETDNGVQEARDDSGGH